MSKFKPQFIQLPLSKMAGCPWNLLDQRGLRVAWCGTDGNHEKDGELIANDLLNLIAIGEAVDELHERALVKQRKDDELIETVVALLDCREDTERTYGDAYDFTFKSGVHRECWNKLIELTGWTDPSQRRCPNDN